MFYAKQNWKEIGSTASSFQQADKFTDIELAVDGQAFRGHKVILAAASAYFETMFSTEFCEKDKTRIEIHGIRRELFQQLFEYIYKRKFEINEDNVQEVLEAANMLQLTCLTSSCCRFLKKKLNEKNAVGIYRLADIYSSTESVLNLKRKCKFFIEQHFLNIIKNDRDFLDLPFNLFESLIKSESLNIHNELDVLKITLNWILKESDVRIKHIYALMRYVRLPVIPEDKKEIVVENLKNEELKGILRQILKQDLNKSQQSLENGSIQPLNNSEEFKSLVSSNLRWKTRFQCSSMFYLVGGRKENSVTSDIMRINSFNYKLTYLKRVPTRRFNHQTAELNGLLYIAGGINGHGLPPLNLVEAFDPYENDKVSTSRMINSRQDFGLVSVNGSLLAIGGSSKFPNLVEQFDPKTNQWSVYDSIDELPVRGFRVVKVDSNKIFIIGGVSRFDQLLDQTLCYNPQTRTIKRLSRMNEKRSSFGCTFSYGFIYVIGGSSSRSCERYSLAEDQWCYIAELDRPIENCSVTVAMNRILLIGGEDPDSRQPQSRIDCYDPECNRWNNETSLPFKLTGTSLVQI